MTETTTDARTEAFEKLLSAVQTLGEFWEDRVTGDQLDNVDLMDIVLNAAEHAAVGGGQPACGHSRIYGGSQVSRMTNGEGPWLKIRRSTGEVVTYRTFSATCGRVAGHAGLHRGGNHQWGDDTPDWGS